VYKLLQDKELKHKDIAALLGIKQPEVSHLMNGHFNRFTTDWQELLQVAATS
jgi:predicted XRE-type DNA-binding protein